MLKIPNLILSKLCLSLLSGLLLLILNSQLHARELILATSKSIPPYIVEADQSGLQIDIVRRTLEKAGHSIKQTIFTSNKRAEQLLRENKVDAVINAPASLNDLYISEPVIFYKNIAISLAKNNIQIASVADLQGLRVMGFQNAHVFLGPAFERMAADNPSYEESVNQNAQLTQLYRESIDVIVLDQLIFNHFNKHYYFDGNIPELVKFHDIFPRSPRTLAFRDVGLRDQFNNALKIVLKEMAEEDQAL